MKKILPNLVIVIQTAIIIFLSVKLNEESNRVNEEVANIRQINAASRIQDSLAIRETVEEIKRVGDSLKNEFIKKTLNSN